MFYNAKFRFLYASGSGNFINTGCIQFCENVVIKLKLACSVKQGML